MAGTGRATSPTEMATAGSTSPGAATNGCGWMGRTSPLRRSRRSSVVMPDVRSVAVYAVPDDPVGDRVMVAIELQAGSTLSPSAFDAFLAAQTDLGPKWVPQFVRLVPELPKLASMKIDKQRLRREAWTRYGRVVETDPEVAARADGGGRQGATRGPSPVRADGGVPSSAAAWDHTMKLSMNVTRRSGAEEPRGWAAQRWRRLVSTRCGSAKRTDSTRSPCSGISPAVPAVSGSGRRSFPVFSRSPALVAMTAAGLDFVSSGRFLLGLGRSGPQVVTDWHGVPYDRPLAAHPRDHRGVPEGVDPTEARVRGGDVPGSAPGGAEGRRWPVVEADRPPCARGDIRSTLLRSGPRTSRARRGSRRGVDPALLPSRQCLRCGQRHWPTEPRRERRTCPDWRSSPAGRWRSVTRTRRSRIRDAMRPRVALYVGGMGPPGQNFYNDLFRSLRL